jgi:hypothetical protein
MRVGLVFGGRSTEHRVSVVSARTVAGALEAAGHHVVPIGIGEDGSWRPVAEGRSALDGRIDILPSRGGVTPRSLGPLLDLEVEVIFPIVHGTWGEDGTLQGLCEMLDLPYAGAGVAATVGGVVVVGTSGCCGGSSSSSSNDFDYEAWAETDGAAGRINMEAVQQAFEQATDPSDFEIRVNEIYEGQHPILIRVHNVGQNQEVEGWEDLDDDGNIVDANDDKLFSLSRPLSGQGQTTLRGHGSNSYYTHHYPMGYPMGGFFTGYLMASMLTRPYYTPMANRTRIVNHVRSYRSSPAWAGRTAANRGYMSRARANPGFAAASRSYSPARNSFRGSVRSSGGSFRSSGGFGRSSGFRGGGR